MDPITLSLLISLGTQLAGMGASTYFSKGRQKDAEQAAQRIAAQQRMVKESDEVSGLQVPTLGSELARQELGQQYASSLKALQQSGAAGVLGGVPALAGIGADQALNIAGDLNRLQAERDRFVAGTLQERAAREARSERDLLGQQLAGAQMSAAQEKAQQQQNVAGMIGAIGTTTGQYIGAQALYKKQPEATSNVAKPAPKMEYEKYAPSLSTTESVSKLGTIEDRMMPMPQIGGPGPEQFLGLPSAGVPSLGIPSLYQPSNMYANAFATPSIGGANISPFLGLSGLPGIPPITFR